MHSCNLKQEAEIFVVSVKLQSASSNLVRILANESLNEKQRENLGWVNNLIGRVDWDAPDYPKSNFSPTLATSIRPYFYRAFIEMKFVPTRDFLDRFHQTLKSEGSKQLLSKNELMKAKELMNKMSGYIISSFQTYQNI